MTTELATNVDADQRRKLVLLKAVGLDRAAPEQRELALAIAKKYDLDLLLKHLVLIDGKPFITRDALLWIAHRSGQFDGITVTRPVIEDDYWYAEATVYRKDMSHPFVYGGRYPVKGKNQTFAPEMAVKVAESMALRRAFNVSAPSADERWDVEVPQTPRTPPPSLAERAAQKRAEVTPEAPTPPADSPEVEEGVYTAEPDTGAPEPPPPTDEAPLPPEPATAATCDSHSPHGDAAPCVRETGHSGNHRSSDKESWS